MFKPKTTIPSLTAAALPLFGCGGDSRGFPEGVNNFCLKIAECYMVDANQCFDLFEPYRDYYDRISDACFNLIGTYYQCLADLSCDVFENSTGAELEALCYADLEDMFGGLCP